VTLMQLAPARGWAVAAWALLIESCGECSMLICEPYGWVGLFVLRADEMHDRVCCAAVLSLCLTPHCGHIYQLQCPVWLSECLGLFGWWPSLSTLVKSVLLIHALFVEAVGSVLIGFCLHRLLADMSSRCL
jgi:hypothetical protein